MGAHRGEGYASTAFKVAGDWGPHLLTATARGRAGGVNSALLLIEPKPSSRRLLDVRGCELRIIPVGLVGLVGVELLRVVLCLRREIISWLRGCWLLGIRPCLKRGEGHHSPVISHQGLPRTTMQN